MVSFDGGSASKVVDVTTLPSRHKMADMCYYGNVMITTRWWLCVTMETLWQQQDGGYALLWKRYDNNKMVAMRYYGNVMTTTMSQHSDDVIYIFNSTVIDWTFFFAFWNRCVYAHAQIITIWQRRETFTINLHSRNILIILFAFMPQFIH